MPYVHKFKINLSKAINTSITRLVISVIAVPMSGVSIMGVIICGDIRGSVKMMYMHPVPSIFIANAWNNPFVTGQSNIMTGRG